MRKKIDPASGNVSSGKASHPARPQPVPTIDVQVKTRTVDGLLLPHVILLSDGRVFTVERVYGSRRDPARDDALRYAVRVGGRTKSIWRREDGTWFVEAVK
ncbi:hypothetical protein [Intestinibacillus massiliensis]|uniref:hypothetical protein n=1 Tax=Intestinibacillus massiliensis TaxID=1871029 RepID=UPI00117B6E49|nr:hypothetical protein [Intestinibacillus massiliensis]